MYMLVQYIAVDVHIVRMAVTWQPRRRLAASPPMTAQTAACRLADLGEPQILEDEIRVGVPVARKEPLQLTVLRRHAGEDGDVITNPAHARNDILLGFQR